MSDANPRQTPLERIGYYRWWIVAMLFFATTINYIDRQVISVLKPQISDALGWTPSNKEILYGYVIMSFQAAYALGYLLAGRLSDVIGLRRGYTLSVAVWSLMAAATGFVRTVTGFCIVRAGLGLSEGGNFPSAIKTVTEWFPAQERALATGIFNAGSNFGPVLTPLIVPPLALAYGWPAAFYVTGAVGALWIIWWLLMYKPPHLEPRLSKAELDYIQSEPTNQLPADGSHHHPDHSRRGQRRPHEVEQESDKPVRWMELLTYRATWGFIVGTLFTSPIWWFYLFWAPDFFFKHFGLDLKTIGPPLIGVYLLADIGSVGGGWLSSSLIKRGRSVNFSRKLALGVCALCVIPIYFAAGTHDKWIAMGLFGLAAAAHQGFSANLYTWVSDTIPKSSVSSVVGMGGMSGGVASIFFSMFVSQVLQKNENYQLILTVAPCAYLIAVVVMHLLVPNLDSAKRVAV